MASFRNKAPGWFWIVAVLVLLWGMMGVAAFYMDVTTTPERLAEMSEYDRELLASRPHWFLWLYGGGVWSGLFGAIALLARSRFAHPLFVLSLVLVVVMFGYFFGNSDIVAVKGFVAAAGFPILIAAIGAFEIWLSNHARRRGWVS
ncbi:hypothetical protein ASG11_13645 [Sphingomonas sp. Leaf357]|uniref:hypothetical protein n=1 Tax=Sphingomonas sp. Leaf357 TaxID=1736350 RepID=UPI0006F27100|nr:hypothetical protein [Sphingomonas sp. Leaf357]KQS01865.1 hypothetical protein ASG11_13645 [Sphingomonas sp. Leaf357]